jgi:hypothetical protein
MVLLLLFQGKFWSQTRLSSDISVVNVVSLTVMHVNPPVGDLLRPGTSKERSVTIEWKQQTLSRDVCCFIGSFRCL